MSAPGQHLYIEHACLAMEAGHFTHEAKARRDYHCRFCRQPIQKGERYRRHGDRAAHVTCAEQWSSLLVQERPHVG